ncbi:hypothetical protein DFH28DRAFT_983398 [Melampsora americana]|nr:hypothetical protein DFH28DRAFT_983398 [Melampsora americana]
MNVKLIEILMIEMVSLALLDLNFVPGLNFSLGKSPVSQFANSASLSVLSPLSVITTYDTPDHLHHSPTLTGSISYICSGLQTFKVIPSKLASLNTFVESFNVPAPPPYYLEDAQLLRNFKGSTTKYDLGKDYLMYGRLHLPTYRLDGLYTKRISPSLQALITLVSIPSNPPFSTQLPSTSDSINSLNSVTPFWNLMIGINHQTNRWSQQYSYSTDDGLFGARVLHNFPISNKRNLINSNSTSSLGTEDDRKKLVDEEEVMDNVLKGRFSAGAEIYFSPKGKSAGVSTGVRFCTIPDPPGVAITQQPTVITATLNPIMGQMSSTYGTKVGRNVALATRFDFNLFSFESDITFGGEWLQRASRSKITNIPEENLNSEFPDAERQCQLKSDSSQSSAVKDISGLTSSFWKTVKGNGNTSSMLKARFSPVTGFTVMWEGKWQECLIGLGLNSEFLVTRSNNSHRAGLDCLQPVIKGVFLELQYNTTSV